MKIIPETESTEKLQRIEVIGAFVDVVIMKGYCRTRMLDVAKYLGCDLLVLRHFNNRKFDILLAVFNEYACLGVNEFKNTPDINEYMFSEKMQLLADTYFEQLDPIRPFIQKVIQPFALSPWALLRLRSSLAEVYKSEISLILDEARKEAQLPPLLCKRMWVRACTDYLFHLTHTWTLDSSPNCCNTTKRIELLTAALASQIQSGLDENLMSVARFEVQQGAYCFQETLTRYIPGYERVKSFLTEPVRGVSVRE